MTDQQILSASANAITQSELKLVIDKVPTNLLQKAMLKLKLTPRKHVYNIKPLYFGALIKVSQLILTLPESLSESTTEATATAIYSLIANHGHTVTTVIATAIQNNDMPVSEHFIKQLLRELTAPEMYRCLSIIYKQLNVESFISSMVLVRGMNIIPTKKTNLEEPEELIASGV